MLTLKEKVEELINKEESLFINSKTNGTWYNNSNIDFKKSLLGGISEKDPFYMDDNILCCKEGRFNFNKGLPC